MLKLILALYGFMALTVLIYLLLAFAEMARHPLEETDE